MRLITTLNHGLSITLVSLSLLTSLPTLAQSDALYSLKNLERERASLLAVYTDASINNEVRQQKIASHYRRMVDIERMVLRDERITNSDKILVQKAFANYDLTFLIHASTEHNTQALSQWMNTLGIHAASITQSKLGYR